MGLVKNLRLLFSDSLLSRMTELENRQDLLEEHVEGRLDSMKQYSARVVKRERDARAANGNGAHTGSAGVPPGLSEAAQKLYQRRMARHGTPGPGS